MIDLEKVKYNLAMICATPFVIATILLLISYYKTTT